MQRGSTLSPFRGVALFLRKPTLNAGPWTTPQGILGVEASCKTAAGRKDTSTTAKYTTLKTNHKDTGGPLKNTKQKENGHIIVFFQLYFVCTHVIAATKGKTGGLNGEKKIKLANSASKCLTNRRVNFIWNDKKRKEKKNARKSLEGCTPLSYQERQEMRNEGMRIADEARYKHKFSSLLSRYSTTILERGLSNEVLFFIHNHLLNPTGSCQRSCKHHWVELNGLGSTKSQPRA